MRHFVFDGKFRWLLNFCCHVRQRVPDQLDDAHIIDWHIRYQKRIDTLKATNVVPVLIRKRAPLMVGVDPTRTAKVMFGYEGLPAS